VSSFNYEDSGERRELDFTVLSAPFISDEVSVIIGEAKSGQALDEKERRKLERLAAKTGCYLAFCTLAEQFPETDKEFFRQLVEAGHRTILLRGPRLEMDYSETQEFKHQHLAPLSEAEMLSRASTIEVLGKEFADKCHLLL